MQHVHEDITKRTIDVGDILIYVGQGGYNSSIPSLKAGEVLGMTKSAVKIKPLDPTQDFRPAKRIEYKQVPNGTFYTVYGGHQRENYELVPIGEIDLEPVSIKDTGERYYILRKI